MEVKAKDPRICYIKPTRHVHDSGYRTFEIGYILEMSDDHKVLKKEKLGEYTDHVYQDYMVLVGRVKPFCINMDLTMDGYIRLWSHDGQVIWDRLPMSSAGLTIKGAK